MPVIELYPNPLPPPGPPETRESTLADLQTGFASLTEDELTLARLWLVGEELDDICHILRGSEKKVRALWRDMRRKVRYVLLDEVERAADASIHATHPGAQPSMETPQETEGATPA